MKILLFNPFLIAVILLAIGTSACDKTGTAIDPNVDPSGIETGASENYVILDRYTIDAFLRLDVEPWNPVSYFEHRAPMFKLTGEGQGFMSDLGYSQVHIELLVNGANGSVSGLVGYSIIESKSYIEWTISGTLSSSEQTEVSTLDATLAKCYPPILPGNKKLGFAEVSILGNPFRSILAGEAFDARILTAGQYE